MNIKKPLIRLSLLLLLILSQIKCYAQFTKGNFSIGIGSQLSYDASTSKNSTYQSFSTSFDPSIARFTSENTLFGIMGGVKYELTKYNTTRFESRNYYVGDMIRKYFQFGNQDYGMILTHTFILGKNTNSYNTSGQKFVRINLRPGFYLHLNYKLLFEFSIGEVYFESRARNKNYGIGLINNGVTFDFNLRYLFNVTPNKKVNRRIGYYE